MSLSDGTAEDDYQALQSLHEEAEATTTHDNGCGCSMCRIRRGAARGGASAGAARRERRRRYLAGELTTSESREYARVLERCRRAARIGGVKAGVAARARRDAARAAVGAQDVDDTTPAVLDVGARNAV